MAKKHKTVRGRRGGTDAEIVAQHQAAARAVMAAVGRGRALAFDDQRRQHNRRRAALIALGIVLALVVVFAVVFSVANKLGTF